jgi:hypothetical protein
VAPTPLEIWAPASCWGQSQGDASSAWATLLPGGARGGGSQGTAPAAPGQAVSLVYSDPGQLAARARLAQHVQGLLLQGCLEGGASGRGLLACLEASVGALVASAAAGARGNRGGGGGGGEQEQGREEERTLALYRLCHTLLGGGGGGGGGGGECHLVQVVEELWR